MVKVFDTMFFLRSKEQSLLRPLVTLLVINAELCLYCLAFSDSNLVHDVEYLKALITSESGC